MSRVRLHNFSISLDGFGTGEGLTDEQPFGHADGRLHQWMFRTAMWGRIMGEPGGSQGVDNDFAEQAWQGFGAEIMGRRKFHVGTGPIPPEWDGFWGSDPSFHTPVIVLTHHTRPSLAMEGGTTFHFRDVTPQEAVDEARELAGGLDIRLGGGVETVRAFLEADLVDHLHVVVVPILLGRGQRLWDGLEGLESRFDLRLVAGEGDVVHVVGDRR